MNRKYNHTAYRITSGGKRCRVYEIGLNVVPSRAQITAAETSRPLADSTGLTAPIEVMRFWNDADRCYAPFPLGLVFVGNNEFSLQVDGDGQSPISAAVADRALYVEAFDYADLTDDDLRMFIQGRGVTDPTAQTAILRIYRAPRAVRSFRRVQDLLDDLNAVTDGRPITGHTVREAMEFG